MLPKILLNQELPRCEWVGNDPMMIDYHDQEWGVPFMQSAGMVDDHTNQCFRRGSDYSPIKN